MISMYCSHHRGPDRRRGRVAPARAWRLSALALFPLAVLPLAWASCVAVPMDDSRISQAQAYDRVGAWAEASVLWTEIYLASSGRDIEAGLSAASASFKAGRFMEARIRLVDLATRAPKDARVFELRGQAHEELGQMEAAEDDYRTALELDPGRPRSLTHLGALMVLGGDVDPGIELMEKGLALDPADESARYRLGVVASQAGRRDKAIEAFARACPSDQVTDLERLEAARLIGSDAAVADWLEPVVRHDPQWTEALWRLGEARTLGGRSVRGLELLERAAETDPGDIAALAAYARGLMGAGRTDDAMAIIEHARSLDLTAAEQAVITTVEEELRGLRN